MSTAYLGLGTNMGDRLTNIIAMLRGLKPRSEILKVSSIYETEPVGFIEQSKFLNAVCLVVTGLSPRELLKWVKRVEKSVGPRASFRNGPRSADIDILFYDDVVMESAELIIPHPKIEERAFVLVPLAEIAPDFVHPVLKRRTSDLLAGLAEPLGVERLNEKLPAELGSLGSEVGRKQVRD